MASHDRGVALRGRGEGLGRRVEMPPVTWLIAAAAVLFASVVLRRRQVVRRRRLQRRPRPRPATG